MNTRKLLTPCTILFIALISSCAKDDFEEIDGVCPIVENTTQQLETLTFLIKLSLQLSMKK
jgi:hypothetical protein